MFLNFSNCSQPILAWITVSPWFQLSLSFPFKPAFQFLVYQLCVVSACSVIPNSFPNLGLRTNTVNFGKSIWSTFQEMGWEFFRGKFQSPVLCSLWENHGRSEGIHNWNPKLWKESLWKASKKKYLVFCESMDTKLKEYSLHISKTLNFNHFETESQMLTVIAVHKILVPLGVPGWPHCFTIFIGLLGGIIIKYPNKQAGQVASMQHSVSLLLSFDVLIYHLLTTMKISSLTTSNPHFLFYWMTLTTGDFCLENKVKNKISEISSTPWRNYLYLVPAFFLLPFSQYKGLECKKTFLKLLKQKHYGLLLLEHWNNLSTQSSIEKSNFTRQCCRSD